MEKRLNLTEEWDKTFPKSEKVDHAKVTFHNRYGITLAADLYVPRDVEGKFPAIAVSGPFGAVKEQASGLYAQTLAERGFLVLAFDPSYTGESGGEPRYVASPDINTEDFCAAVDYLATRDEVDENRIGILGICGFGGFALNAAAIDTRIKATVASTMYDMSRVTANGYFDGTDADARYELRRQLNAQRTEDYKNGTYALAGGVADPLPEDAATVCEGLPCLLQDTARLPQTFAQFERRLEQNLIPPVHQHADTCIQQRNTECRTAHPRGKSPFALFQRGRVQDIARPKQGVIDHPRSHPRRSLRQSGSHSIRQARTVLQRIPEIKNVSSIPQVQSPNGMDDIFIPSYSYQTCKSRYPVGVHPTLFLKIRVKCCGYWKPRR